MATANRPARSRSGATWFILGIGGGALVALGIVLLASGLLRKDGAHAMAPPRFVEETQTAGIDHVYGGDFTYFVGGGVAAFDCDEDGRPDLYFAGGANPAALYLNQSAVGESLRFEQIADPITDLTDVIGAYPLDIDGDGHIDLAVLRLGKNVLLRGLGDCGFERANRSLGYEGGDAWTAGFSATWEGGADLPTLAFGNYLDLAKSQDRATCADSELVRPVPGAASYHRPTPLSPGYCTLSVLFSDWSHSGERDLRMTNDRHYYTDGEEQLWRIADGEPPRMYTSADGWRPMQIWGMGIATYDVTGDGLPEVFLTSQADNKLQTLADGAARPTYRDIALPRGVTAHKPYAGGDPLPSTAWHPEFEDVNNDGFIDLFISKGNVDAMPDFAVKDPSDLLLGRPDGTFVETGRAAGIVSFDRGRGAALVDLNLDGMLDLVLVNRSANVSLWRNVGLGRSDRPEPMGNWMAVRVEQPGPNHDAIGAWIEVKAEGRTAEREVTIGGGHAGGQLGWIHFGLGGAESAMVRVQWPDGELGPWLDVDANGFATIERGAPEPAAWSPPTG